MRLPKHGTLVNGALRSYLLAPSTAKQNNLLQEHARFTERNQSAEVGCVEWSLTHLQAAPFEWPVRGVIWTPTNGNWLLELIIQIQL
jgi:hypothetical protein